MKTNIKQLSVILLVMICLSMMPITPFAAVNLVSGNTGNYFSDMPDNWSTNALKKAVLNGLLTETDGRIMPDAHMTRAQVAMIVAHAFGATVEGDLSEFSDIDTDSPDAEGIARAYHMGVMEGSGGKFHPSVLITRQEVFVILARALKLEPSATSDRTFADIDTLSEWAKEEVYSLMNSGYIEGTNGKLNPKVLITRAEFAKVMDRIIKQYVDENAEVNEETVGASDTAGNLLIKTSGVTVKNLTVNGDLIVGDGVSTGEVVLDNVKISGRLIARCSRDSSIVIKANSIVPQVTLVDVNGVTTIEVDDNAFVGVIYTVEARNNHSPIEGGGLFGSMGPIPIESIEVSASDNKTMISNGATLAFTAVILPENATHQTIKWTAEGGPAIIDASTGVLQATGTGKILVSAIATDGSGIVGSTVVLAIPATPAFSVNYLTEKTNEIVQPTIEYSLDQGSNWVKGTNQELDLTPGQTVQFRGVASGYIPVGETQMLAIKNRPLAPAFAYADGIKGTLYGLPANAQNLEVRISSDKGASWGAWNSIMVDSLGKAPLAHNGGALIQVRAKAVADQDFVGVVAEQYARQLISTLKIGDKVVDTSWAWQHKTGPSGYMDGGDPYSGTGVTKPVVWRLVARDHYGSNSGITLLSEELIGKFAFNVADGYSKNWEISDLRMWLNGSGKYSGNGFYNAFSVNFQRQVKSVSIPNNNWYKTFQTSDLVFIPSAMELGYTGSDYPYVGFSDLGTAYAYFADKSEAATVSKLGNANVPYWTRTPLGHPSYTMIYSGSGGMPTASIFPWLARMGVRPVLNFATDIIVSGAPNETGAYEIFYE